MEFLVSKFDVKWAESEAIFMVVVQALVLLLSLGLAAIDPNLEYSYGCNYTPISDSTCFMVLVLTRVQQGEQVLIVVT